MNKDQKLLEEAYQSIYQSMAISRKYPKYFGNPSYQRNWEKILDNYNFAVTPDGSVNIYGDFAFHGEYFSKNMDRLPFNFASVSEDFSISYCENLKSLEGAPQFVPGSFVCDACNLKTLKGAPRKVGKYFQCDNNELTSLEGAPEHVGTNFWANDNPIISLEGAPEFIGGKIALDNFSQEDYEKFRRDRRVDKKVNKELGDFDLDVLKDF